MAHGSVLPRFVLYEQWLSHENLTSSSTTTDVAHTLPWPENTFDAAFSIYTLLDLVDDDSGLTRPIARQGVVRIEAALIDLRTRNVSHLQWRSIFHHDDDSESDEDDEHTSREMTEIAHSYWSKVLRRQKDEETRSMLKRSHRNACDLLSFWIELWEKMRAHKRLLACASSANELANVFGSIGSQTARDTMAASPLMRACLNHLSKSALFSGQGNSLRRCEAMQTLDAAMRRVLLNEPFCEQLVISSFAFGIWFERNRRLAEEEEGKRAKETSRSSRILTEMRRKRLKHEERRLSAAERLMHCCSDFV